MSHIFRPADYERTKRKRASGTSHDDRSTPSLAPTVLVNSESPESVCSSPVPPRRVFVELPIPRTHLNLCSPRPIVKPADPSRSLAQRRETRHKVAARVQAQRETDPFEVERRGVGERGRRVGEREGGQEGSGHASGVSADGCLRPRRRIE